jgi:hypothetical protein
VLADGNAIRWYREQLKLTGADVEQLMRGIYREPAYTTAARLYRIERGRICRIAELEATLIAAVLRVPLAVAVTVAVVVAVRTAVPSAVAEEDAEAKEEPVADPEAVAVAEAEALKRLHMALVGVSACTAEQLVGPR